MEEPLTQELRDFLRAAFDYTGAQGSPRFDTEVKTYTGCDGAKIADVVNDGKAHTYLATFVPEASLPSEYVGVFFQLPASVQVSDLPIKPSFLLSGAEADLVGYLLDRPVSPGSVGAERLIDFARQYDVAAELGEPMPCPGYEGWELFFDADETTLNGDTLRQYTLGQIASVMRASDTPAAPAIQKHNDAEIWGTLDPLLLNREIEIAGSKRGRLTPPKGWVNSKMKVGSLIDLLSRHKPGVKDGECIIQGSVIGGERKAVSVRQLDILMLDLDTGETFESIKQRIEAQGLFAVMWTTHSHMKGTTDVPKDKVMKWCDTKSEPTLHQVVNYLKSEKRYRPHVLDGENRLETLHTSDGIMLRLTHQPMEKVRILFLLQRPFVIAERSPTQKGAIDEWKERYAGASRMLEAFFDRACVDPSRLMYTPRHVEGAPNRIAVIAGKALDIDHVSRVPLKGRVDADAFSAAANSLIAGAGASYKTPGLMAFIGKYSDVFDADQMLLDCEPEEDRGSRNNGPGRAHTCPNDDSHSNAGDREDKGFFCVNAADQDTGFTMKCMHDSCADADRVVLLDLACQKHNLSVTDLLKWCAELREEDEVATPIEPENIGDERVAELSKRIHADLKWDESPTATEQNIVTAMGWMHEANLAPVTQTQVKQILAKASGLHRRDINKIIKTLVPKSMSLRDKADGDEAMKEFNKRFAVVMNGSKTIVIENARVSGEMPPMMMKDSFLTFYGNQYTLQPGADGTPTRVSIAKKWIEWDGRRSYTKIEFEPDNPSLGAFNLWTGFAVSPIQGDWSKLRNHIWEVLANCNEQHFNWIMTWFADIIQHPGSKPGSALVVKGQKGVGKSIVFQYMSRLLGIHAIKVAHRRRIVGNFNAHFMGKLFMVCEEAFWAGDPESGGVLKDIITSDEMSTEAKGQDIVTTSNYTRLAFSSNEAWVIPASIQDERRFFVVQASEKYRGNLAYFKAIQDQMDNGGLAAMLFELKNWKPMTEKAWDILRQPPYTSALKDQALFSTDPQDRWFIDLIENGEAGDDENGAFQLELKDESIVPLKLFRAVFENSMKGSAAKYKIGMNRFVTDYAKKYLLAEIKERTERSGRLERVIVCPSLVEIRDNARTLGIEFEQLEML